ncbi:MAG: DNA replication and repair protein RecF [Flexilinea sp.]|nr:DNA replication and repair protein RecF [Flexilinea sp.]
MILRHLSLSNFRSYLRLDTDIPRRILLLSGGNAQGKTTLLESLFYCASFSSPLSAADRQLIHFNVLNDPVAVARMIVEFEREGASHRMEVRIILENAEKGGRTRKEILLDGIKSSAQKAIGTFPCVLFLPQMTRILEGPPDERRRYMNIMLSQSVPGYARALSEQKQILTRRNALLKLLAERRTDPSQLDYWDMMLAQRSAILIRQRANALLSLKKFAQEIHLQLTDSHELLSLSYLPGFDPLHPDLYVGKPAQNPVKEEAIFSLSDDEIIHSYTRYLKEFRENDIRRGSTSVGAHRDDFSIFSSGIDLCTYGSRGQVRTALLSLKLAEIEWMKEHTGTSPLLLLDETLAELDEKRSLDLLSRLEQYDQAILTTTDQTHFPTSFTENNTIWQVNGGVIKK